MIFELFARRRISLQNKVSSAAGRTSRVVKSVLERPDSWGIGIRRWRLAFEEWLAGADRVIYPSQYVRKVIEDYFPQVQGEVWPHPEQAMSEFSGFAERSLACRKFVLIGALSAAKGLHRLTELANLSLQSEEPFEFVVVGPTLEPLASTAEKRHGYRPI